MMSKADLKGKTVRRVLFGAVDYTCRVCLAVVPGGEQGECVYCITRPKEATAKRKEAKMGNDPDAIE